MGTLNSSPIQRFHFKAELFAGSASSDTVPGPSPEALSPFGLSGAALAGSLLVGDPAFSSPWSPGFDPPARTS